MPDNFIRQWGTPWAGRVNLHLKMTSRRSKCHGFLLLVFIVKWCFSQLVYPVLYTDHIKYWQRSTFGAFKRQIIKAITCKIYYLFVSLCMPLVPKICHIFCEGQSLENLFLLDLHYQTTQEAKQR